MFALDKYRTHDLAVWSHWSHQHKSLFTLIIEFQKCKSSVNKSQAAQKMFLFECQARFFCSWPCLTKVQLMVIGSYELLSRLQIIPIAIDDIDAFHVKYSVFQWYFLLKSSWLWQK